MKYSVCSGVLPELGPEQVVETLARHGYDGVEWRVNGEYHFSKATIDAEAPRIKAMCDARGIAVAGLTTFVEPDDDDDIRRMIAGAQGMGCPRFRFFSGRYDKSLGYRAILDATKIKLVNAQRLLDGSGVKGLIEVHFGTIACGPATARELVGECDPGLIGVIWDPGNMVIEGSMDLQMSVDILGEYIDHVHVKNTRWEPLEGGTWRWRFDELAEGTLNWAEAIGGLARIGYDGYLSFENLYRVPVKHRGFIGEDLTIGSDTIRDIDQRLSHELAYTRRLVVEA
ncbi:MAG: sugar phosphate isomerase/epimerase family protein [Alphaproteobacteria bacterium]|nr:sugar phosphate isomerase/epimerase family protein [Alphaproteobacteria bacterium]MDP7487461.1 sugar phosphate isomerase/epimerase family protein [Alphaproteobacteria bacterium]